MGHDEVIIGPLKEAHHPSLAPDDEMSSSSAESQRGFFFSFRILRRPGRNDIGSTNDPMTHFWSYEFCTYVQLEEPPHAATRVQSDDERSSLRRSKLQIILASLQTAVKRKQKQNEDRRSCSIGCSVWRGFGFCAGFPYGSLVVVLCPSFHYGTTGTGASGT